MFRSVLRAISATVSGANALDMAAHIHDLDRWSSFDRHREASSYCRQKMRQYGLFAECIPVTADGESVFGDFIMPRAWDATQATLILLNGGRREAVELCRYTHDPCCLVVHSIATPPGGVTAEVVMMDGGSDEVDYRNTDVRGKVIFTAQSARACKTQAVKHGAVGIISDFLPQYPMRPALELPDTLAWERFMSDHTHGGWGMRKGDSECWGFVLSSRQGQWLRSLIAREGTVRVRAQVHARLYDGTFDIVTGWIPGQTDEQVVLNGHLYEYGAIDDASGAAVSIEVLRVLQELIEAGRLPAPKRGIRMAFTYECMGTMAAVVQRRDIYGPNTVAGLTLDCVGGRESLNRAPLDLRRNPHSAGCHTDVLLRAIMEHLSDEVSTLVNWREASYGSADNLIADPSIGIPCPALMESPYLHYHSSTDTPDKLDPERLAWVGKAAATYAWFLANAGGPEARWLAQQVFTEAHHKMVEDANRFVLGLLERTEPDQSLQSADLWRRLHYQRYRYRVAMDGVKRLSSNDDVLSQQVEQFDDDLSRIADLEFRRAARSVGRPARRPAARASRYGQQTSHLVPYRLVIGPMRHTRIPADERQQWETICNRGGVGGQAAMHALFWANGERTIAEIEQLVAGECDLTGVKLLEFFQVCDRYGYVTLREV